MQTETTDRTGVAGGHNREDTVDGVGSALQSLARSMRRSRMHEVVLAEAGVEIDRAGMAVLSVLDAHQSSLRLTAIAEELRIEAPAVTRKAQQLERIGLIARSDDPTDKRATRLGLTDEGRRVISLIIDGRRRWLTELLSDWSVEDQATLGGLLRRFADVLDRSLEEIDG